MLPKLLILASCQKNIEEPSQVDSANSFNDFFINIGSNLTKHLKKDTRPRLKSNAYSTFLNRKNLSEIQKIMQGLDNKSSSGEDNLSNIINQNFWFGNSSILRILKKSFIQ